MIIPMAARVKMLPFDNCKEFAGHSYIDKQLQGSTYFDRPLAGDQLRDFQSIESSAEIIAIAVEDYNFNGIINSYNGSTNSVMNFDKKICIPGGLYF